jgi:histidine triad (HIT) family protein
MAKVGAFDFYCEVALKEGADIKKVFETERVLAFHHTKPAYKKHVVVIPKKHVHDLRYVDDKELLAELIDTCRNILRDWDENEIELKGARVITNLGKFQDTPHLHFHVIAGEKII